jgi:mxaA protein
MANNYLLRHYFLLIALLLAPAMVSAEDKLAITQSLSNEPAQITWRAEDPRPFGYVIGDELSRRIEIDAPSTYILQADSLPRLGRVDAWLELRKINMTKKSFGDSTRHTLDLQYQIMNSPDSVKTHSLYKLLIIFNYLNSPRSAEITDAPFTVSPITPEYVLARAGLEEMRPDQSAPLISASAHYWRLGVAALALAGVLLSLVYMQWGMPFLRRHNGPFARAWRDIKKLGDVDKPAALRRLHRAFDETAGVSIFPQHLPEFFSRHPAFIDLQQDTHTFFDASRGAFFSSRADNGNGLNASWLMDFCARCRDRERGMQ